ncbi:extracellular solute-binding protein [Brachybacterium sp. Marseille-Q2903]|uniref:Extracellular solute-binding protein n=1 Tax=Brachybacterium epidermidis TaxID=2781983 RepID=A0ABR9W472_9MICO|nr:extracellular solute-binding protein [Brachybacterium epidermidis]MBE9405192.1 extracellular solute-binding protein [Brachybacterium epidermidis]
MSVNPQFPALRTSRRRFLGLGGAAIGAAAAGGLLAGCGNDSSGESGPVELTFWAWAPEIEKLVEIWNQQNPDITVTVSRQDAGDAAATKLLTAIKAGKGAPDLMQAEYQAIPSMVANDALADISEHLNSETPGHFNDGVWNSVTLGSDAVYAIPQDTGPLQFYYREDVFSDLGIDAPVTWEEYAEAARTIHEADPSMYLGTFSSKDPGLFAGLAQQAGASWWGIDGEAWSVQIDDDATRKVAEFWGGLVEEGVISNQPMYTPEWNAALNDGTQVGWVSAVWAPGVLAGNAADTQGKWKMATIPQWDAASPATGNWGGSSTAVTSQSAHPEAAVKFAEWLNTSADGVAGLVEHSAVYPADTEHASTALDAPPAFFDNQPDFYEITEKNAEAVQSFTFGPNVNVTYSLFNDEFSSASEARSQQAFVDALGAMQDGTVDDLTKQGFSVK